MRSRTERCLSFAPAPSGEEYEPSDISGSRWLFGEDACDGTQEVGCDVSAFKHSSAGSRILPSPFVYWRSNCLRMCSILFVSNLRAEGDPRSEAMRRALQGGLWRHWPKQSYFDALRQNSGFAPLLYQLPRPVYCSHCVVFPQLCH